MDGSLLWQKHFGDKQMFAERGALTVVGMSASALRYTPAPDRDAVLRARIVALAHRHRRYGAGMIDEFCLENEKSYERMIRSRTAK